MLENEGVLVGCDERQEWLLPWWWSHFHKHNPQYPVAFADFGMSCRARDWCAEKGPLIPISEPPLAEPEILGNWEKKEGLWTLRKLWFKKPIALSHSPFLRTLWLDLDCEVRENLKPLLSLPLFSAKFGAVSWETNRIFEINKVVREYPHYNSGVVLFEKNSPLLNLWVRAIPEGSRVACTEEDLLDFIIAYFQIPIVPLPLQYNWEILRFGFNSEALIYHWMGEQGKEAIRDSL